MLVQAIAKGLDSMSGLTRMHFSLYDDEQHLLASSISNDKLLSIVNANSKVQALYKDFLDRQLKLSLLRQNPFIVQGLTGQYHAFIPLNYEGTVLTVVAEAFYTSRADFKRFYFSDYGRALGITSQTEEDWLRDIRFYSSEEIASILDHSKSILQSLITFEFDNDRLNKSSQQANTIISIMSDINSNYSVRNIYQIVIDAVIFLFEIDTAAFFVRKDGQYQPEVLEGRKKEIIREMRISVDNRLITKATSAESSFSTMNRHELLHAGFPEDINLVTLFPFSTEAGLLGILSIFNSHLDKETCESIINLCKLTSYLCGIRRKREELEMTSDQLKVLSIQASSLYSLYHERSRLYEGIVSEASNLADAEKCSLMMPHDKEMLEVRAAKGINRWLMENVRVRKGEGISGKVYQQGLPVLINGEAAIRKYGTEPRSHYKTSSSLSLPLKVADEVIGVLNLSDKRSGVSFAQSDISLLSPFMLQASTILKLCICNDTLEEMKKLSMTDSLTGLFNRRYFDIRLEEEFLRAKRYNLILSLAILDIDDFKPFNDTEGHIAGDTMLKEVAYIMTCAVRSHDILARFGGEEFAIIMPQTPKAEAFRVSERIRENIKRNIKPTWKKYHKKQLTLCSGVATYPGCGPLKEELIRCADKALYQAKNSGKDMTIAWE
ncbi:MAG: sensor domain-containing diguanylate cyclase [Dissulfurispiraceae bacterium]